MTRASGIRAGRAYVELGVNDKLAAGLAAAAKRLRTWGRGVAMFGAKAVGLGTALATPLLAATRTFGSFEQQMNMVSTMLDEPEKHMDRFAAGIRRLSVEFGEGTDVLAKGLYDLLSASVDPAKALDVLAVAAKAAKGGMTDTSVAVDGLTSVLNAFQMSADQAGRVADTMFATVKRGKLTFPDLAANIGKVAPMARAAGMSMQDMMAAIATMTRQGLSADEATTRLVNILKAAPEAAGDLGELVARYAGKSLAEIQIDFPEISAAGGIAALASDLTGLRKDMQLMRDSAGQADAAYMRMAGGVAQAFGQIKQAVLEVAVSVGQTLAPILRAVADWTVSMAPRISAWLAANRGLVLTLAAVAGALLAAGVAAIALGGVVAVLGHIVGLVSIAWTLLGAAMGAIATPVGLAVAAVAALAGYLLYASESGGKAVRWLGERFAALKADAVSAYGGIADALAAGDIALAARVLWSYLKLVWQQGVGWISTTWAKGMGWITKVLSEAWSGLRIVFESVVWGLSSAWDWLTTGIWNAASWIWDKLQQGWESATAAVASAWNWMLEQIGERSEQEANDERERIARERAERIAAIKAEGEAWRRKQEQERKDRQAARDQEFDSATDKIVGEQEARELALAAEQAAKERAAAAEVAKARQEFDAAVAKARQRRQARAAEPGPDALKGPQDLLDKAASLVAGVTLPKASAVRGTFNAAGTWGLTATSRTLDRIAAATEQTAKNTRLQRPTLSGDLPTFA